jgi:protein-L-isoaspartate(D-aspartate) O-methyltransferase
LWLALALPGFGRLTAQREAVDRGIVAHAWPLGVPTSIDGGSFAYLGLRPVTPDRQWVEFGAYTHGPDAETIARQMIRPIQSWDHTSLRARIQAHPAGTPDVQLPEDLILDKRHTRAVISWP